MTLKSFQEPSVKSVGIDVIGTFWLATTCCIQWWIQDFPDGGGRGAPTSKVGAPTYYLAIFFIKNSMKMKKFGPGRDTHPWRHPLDPTIGISDVIGIFWWERTQCEISKDRRLKKCSQAI